MAAHQTLGSLGLAETSARGPLPQGGVLRKATPVLEFSSKLHVAVEAPDRPNARPTTQAPVTGAITTPTATSTCPRVRAPFPVIGRIVRRTMVDAREGRVAAVVGMPRMRYVLAALAVMIAAAGIGGVVGIVMRFLAVPTRDAVLARIDGASAALNVAIAAPAPAAWPAVAALAPAAEPASVALPPPPQKPRDIAAPSTPVQASKSFVSPPTRAPHPGAQPVAKPGKKSSMKARH